MTVFGTLTKEGKVVDEITIDLSKVHSSDPIAFSFGVTRGRSYKEGNYTTFKKIHGYKYKEVAQEYLRGCKLGATGILLPEGTKIPKGLEFNYWGSEFNLLKP
jgi:hypothetical protein